MEILFKKLFMEISGKCIGRCPGCFSTSKDYYDINIFQSILTEAHYAGFNWVGLCGKDVLQQPHCKELLHFALNKGFYVRVYSCLLHDSYETQSYANLSAKLDITFILWGMPKIHDLHCGIKGAFEDSFQKLLTWKQSGARVAVKYFPQDESTCDINELKRIFNEMDIPLFVSVWWAPLQFHRYRNGFQPLSAVKAAEVLKGQNQVLNFSYDIQNPPCKAGRQRAFISSGFLLKSCFASEIPIADLKKQSFYEVWNDDSYWGKWRSIQFMDLHECRNCQHKEFCHVCPSTFIEKGSGICNIGKLEWAKVMHKSLK